MSCEAQQNGKMREQHSEYWSMLMFAADKMVSTYVEEALGASIRQALSTPINPRGYDGKNMPKFTTNGPVTSEVQYKYKSSDK